MGIPQFAAWLRQKYPAIVQSSSALPSLVHGLYIDLNGIIHPCCHGDDDDDNNNHNTATRQRFARRRRGGGGGRRAQAMLSPSRPLSQRSEEEMIRQVCFAVEQMVVSVQPQCVLYIAIDGVAPRAKANQQRARRYMAAAVPCSDDDDDGLQDDGARAYTRSNDNNNDNNSDNTAGEAAAYTPDETAEVASELDAVAQSLLRDPLYGGSGNGNDSSRQTHDDDAAVSAALDVVDNDDDTVRRREGGDVATDEHETNNNNNNDDDDMWFDDGAPDVTAAAADGAAAHDNNDAAAAADALPPFDGLFANDDNDNEDEEDEYGGAPGCPYYGDRNDDKQQHANAQPWWRRRHRRTTQHDNNDEAAHTSGFDSNAISPGTAFMHKLSAAVHRFVAAKLANGDDAWSPLHVIVSDSSVPGEGEHKIIDFLRVQASHNGFGVVSRDDDDNDNGDDNANGTGRSSRRRRRRVGARALRGAHVIAGLDADFVLLALSLHLHGVYILRDDRRISTYARERRVRDSNNEDDNNDDNDNDNDDDYDKASEDDDANVYVPSTSAYEYFSIDILADSLVSEVCALARVRGVTALRTRDTCTHNDDNDDDCNRTAAWPPRIAANGYNFDDPPSRHAPHTTRDADDDDDDADVDNNNNNNVDKNDSREITATTTQASWHPCTAASNAMIIDDLVALASVMGNDFLPRLPSALCACSAMDNVLEVYVAEVLPYGYLTGAAPHTTSCDDDKTQTTTATTTTTTTTTTTSSSTCACGGGMRREQLCRFMRGYSRVEAGLFRRRGVARGELDERAVARPVRMAYTTVHDDDDDNNNNSNNNNNNNSNSDDDDDVDAAWRATYVRSTDLRTTARVREACAAYVDGLSFVWRYYTTSPCVAFLDWSWYYPFHHAPLAVDVATYLQSSEACCSCTATATTTQAVTCAPPPIPPPHPLTQLLCILPVTSIALLPRALHACMRSACRDVASSTAAERGDAQTRDEDNDNNNNNNDDDDGDDSDAAAALRDTFARAWCVDFISALDKSYMATVRLPFADAAALQRCVDASLPRLSPDERARVRTTRDAMLYCTRDACTCTRSGDDKNNNDEMAALTPPPPRCRVLYGDVLRHDDVDDDADNVDNDCTTHDKGAVRRLRVRSDATPRVRRPRTYTCAVPIPNLTRTAAGGLVRANVLRRHATRAQGSRNNHNDDNHNDDNDDDEASDAEAVTATATARRDTMPRFGEVLVCVACVAVATALCIRAAAPRALLQTAAAFVVAMAVALVTGLAARPDVLMGGAGAAASSSRGRAASVLRRHQVRMTYVDWQCVRCLSLNFACNVRCYVCRAPYDAHRCGAVHTSKLYGGSKVSGGGNSSSSSMLFASSTTTAALDADHRAYVVRYRLHPARVARACRCDEAESAADVAATASSAS